MKNNFLPLPQHSEKRFSGRFKTTIIALALLCGGQFASAQSVGINTNNPDPSASLEVAGTNKGLLIPRISLTSSTDKTTIPNPATALLVYNTNAGLGKAGFYYNSGTAGNPIWTNLGGLTFPSYNSPNVIGAAFYLENLSQSANAIGIQSTTNYGAGLHGSTVFGQGVVGFTFQNGIGVLAEAQDLLGTALKVSGKMRISGPGQSPGAGKVLTSDANGFATWQNPLGVGNDAVAFSASGVKSGGSINLTPGVSTKVAFGIEDYDTGSDYIDGNGNPHSTFFTPFNGIYHFDACATFSYSVNLEDYPFTHTLRLMRTRANMTQEVAASILTNSTNLGSSVISKDIQLQAGDRLHVEVVISIPEPAATQLSPAATSTYFNGHLVLKQ